MVSGDETVRTTVCVRRSISRFNFIGVRPTTIVFRNDRNGWCLEIIRGHRINDANLRFLWETEWSRVERRLAGNKNNNRSSYTGVYLTF